MWSVKIFPKAMSLNSVDANLGLLFSVILTCKVSITALILIKARKYEKAGLNPTYFFQKIPQLPFLQCF